MSTRDITLNWSDTNLIEKGYRIYRSKAVMDINNMPTPLSTLEKNSTSFTDIDVYFDDNNINDVYYYRVSAYIDGHEVFSDEIIVENIPSDTSLEFFVDTPIDNSYISTPYHIGLQKNSSISMWLYPRNLSGSSSSSRQTIYCGDTTIWNTGVWANGGIFRAHINGEYKDYTSINNDVWSHVVIIYGENNIQSVHINNVEYQPNYTKSGYTQPVPSQYIVGAETSSGAYPWQGMISKFKVYERHLSVSEIELLYSESPT